MPPLKSEVEVKVSLLCWTLCNPMVYSLPGSSVHGVLQVRMLEWVLFPAPMGLQTPSLGYQNFKIISD